MLVRQLNIRCLLFLISLVLSSIVFGQDFSNKGKEFWVGYGSHVSMYASNGTPVATGGTQDMVLYFTSDQNADVTVEIPSTGWTRTYKVIANQVTTSDKIPKTGSDDVRLTDEGKSSKGIHITSNVGIIAYAHIYNGSISGASLLFPVSTLSRDYYSLNYTQVSNAAYSYCFAYVIATEDNTNIEIIPSANTLNNLKVLHYDQCDINSSSDLKQTRGIIYSSATSTSTASFIATIGGTSLL